MGCGVYWQQIRTVERDIEVMRRYGVLETDPGFQAAWRRRGQLLAQVGRKFPRTMIDLTPTIWISPESLKLMEDPEFGFVVMARRAPGVPAIYHRVSDDEAMAIMRREISQELKERLLKPDEYLGE